MNSLLLNGTKLTIEEIPNSENVKKILTKEEEYIMTFIKSWLNGQKTFTFQTSGSTGKPKEITHQKAKLAYSAEQTLNHLKLLETEGKALLCIPPQFIGGSMVIVRTLCSRLQLEYIHPENLLGIEDTYELVSLVPLQIKKILENKPELFQKFNSVLIGGAPLDYETEKQLLSLKISTRFFATFGMTETASHIALRPIGSDYFQVIGDTQIELSQENTLRLKGTLSDNQWLETNDIVELTDKGFKWLGRKDHVINSGGFKVSPEKVEKVLAATLHSNFIVTGIPDAALGEKVVLIIEGESTDYEPTSRELHKFERPKEVYFLKKLIYTPTGKINRIKTRELILNDES